MLLGQSNLCNFHEISLLLQLLAQFLRCLALLCRKDGLKAVVAQNLLLTQQLIVLNRGRKRAPSISPLHRIWRAFFLMFLSTRRLHQTAVAFRPSTFYASKSSLSARNTNSCSRAENNRSLAQRVRAERSSMLSLNSSSAILAVIALESPSNFQ